jgi:hypothetical protein
MLKLSGLSLMAIALATACAPQTSTKGQFITCETDEDSGVILSCQPSDGDPAPGSCVDVDEDGDGMPEDDDATDEDSTTTTGDGTLAFSEGSGSDSDDTTSETEHDCDEDGDGLDDADDPDDDGDGVDDEDDCDEEEGEDSDESELPYDIKMSLNTAYTPIADAFAENGGQPAAIVSVEMDGGGAGWRLSELQSGASFTITNADCSHDGNRDVGRDRVIVTWRNADGSTESDHLDLRYCE